MFLKNPNMWHLLVQSQQWKNQKNVLDLFEVNTKDTGTT